METIKIKPKKGLTVLDPTTYAPLKKSGETKPKNEYWLRRVADGDVEIIKNKGEK
jgi:hypothetical protein